MLPALTRACNRSSVCSTHAHTDHLVGLCEGWDKGRIVASTETAKMLIKRFPSLKKDQAREAASSSKRAEREEREIGDVFL